MAAPAMTVMTRAVLVVMLAAVPTRAVFVVMLVAVAAAALALGRLVRTVGMTGFRFGCAHRWISFGRDNEIQSSAIPRSHADADAGGRRAGRLAFRHRDDRDAIPPHDSSRSPGRTAPRRLLLVGAAVVTAGIVGAAVLASAGTHRPALVPTTPTATPRSLTSARLRPIVYIQAGHQPPGEPGYTAQTGASGGPFGTEVAFNVRLARALSARLRASGVIVRQTPAKVTPWGARGAVFISLHFDAAGGSAGIGYAVHQRGRGENYYQGEGSGTARPVPYPNSAPHRKATAVTTAVQQSSLRLARDLAATFGPIHTRANGARGRFRGVEPGARGNVRMQFFYGYYRVNTRARVLIECGAADLDSAFLGRVSLIAGAIDKGLVAYLHQTKQL